jgi:holo-[acyl-carrier protein] synthase
MIVGIGTDIISVARIERVIERNSEFVHKVFSASEIAYCDARAAKAQSYAARFAAKEAVMKALGTGWAEGVNWLDIQVVMNEAGKPSLNLSGKALALSESMQVDRLHLSLSHEKEQAVAFVILESSRLRP